MSLEGIPQRTDAPLPTVPRSLHDRFRSTAAERIAERARVALGALAVNVSRLDPDGMISELAFAVEPGARYAKTIAAARRLVPGFELMRVAFKATINPSVAAVHIGGITVVAPMPDMARGTVNPWIVRVATMFFDLRWTLSVPLRANGRIVGSLAAHFPRQPTDAERALAEAYANDCAAELEKAGFSLA
jgi:GAF domain-containing protein